MSELFCCANSEIVLKKGCMVHGALGHMRAFSALYKMLQQMSSCCVRVACFKLALFNERTKCRNRTGGPILRRPLAGLQLIKFFR